MPQKAATATKHTFYDLTADAGLSLQDFYVEGRVHTDPDLLRAIVNLKRGEPILSFSPKVAQDTISKISWVKKASVSRRLPSTIYIHIAEHEPVALFRDKAKLSVLNVEGDILSDNIKPEFKTLPILNGKNAPQNFDALYNNMKAEPALFARWDQAVFVNERRWDLVLSDDIRVKLPSDNITLALHSLVRTHDDSKLLDKDISEIDLRMQGRIIVKTRPGTVREYKASFTPSDEHNSDI